MNNTLMKRKNNYMSPFNLFGNILNSIHEPSYDPFTWGYDTITKEYFNDNSNIEVLYNKEKTHKIVNFPLSGYAKDQVDLYIKDDMLVVIAKRHDEKYNKRYKQTYTYRLTENDMDYEASFENGMLRVVITQKVNHSETPDDNVRRIDIK